MSDEKLSSAYRLTEPPSPHLAEETWEALVDGTLPASERDAAQEHVTRCEACAMVYRGLQMFERESRSMASGQSLLAQAAPARRWQPIGLAALAAAAAFLAFWLGLPRPAHDQSALRGGATAVVQLLRPTTGTGGVPTFAWTPLDAATRYRVGLFSEDGRPVWTREVEAPPLRWPDEVPRTAGAYRWRVEALAGGAVVARSRLGDLEIAR